MVPADVLEARFDHVQTRADLIELRGQRVGLGGLETAPSSSTNTELIAAVMTVRKAIPTTITSAATNRPECSRARGPRSRRS